MIVTFFGFIFLVWIAALKLMIANYKGRKHQQFSKTIYNYQGKTQAQILAILTLELDCLKIAHNYRIHSFSKPIFKKDASAEYIVYLEKKGK